MTTTGVAGLSSVFPRRAPDRALVTDALIKEARDRQRRRWRWLALVAAAVIGLGFYGMSHHTASGYNAARTPAVRAYPHPCSLLSNAEVAAVFSKALATRNAKGDACTWSSLPLGTFTSANAQVFLIADKSTKARFERGERLEERFGSDVIPISGIGTAAFGTQSGNGYVMVNAWEHGVAVSVLVLEVNSPVHVEKHLAQLALAHA